MKFTSKNRCTWFDNSRAKDRIDLERHYNIKNELKDFGYTYLIFKKKIKKAIRDVKVKLGLKSK